MGVEYLIQELSHDGVLMLSGLRETLEHLAPVGRIDNDWLAKLVGKMRCQGSYVYAAIEHTDIIGVATILVEQKLIHEGGIVGHIEDVVVRKGYEGQGIGTALVTALIERAHHEGCYKIVLDCKDENLEFYQHLGFQRRDNFMRLDL